MKKRVFATKWSSALRTRVRNSDYFRWVLELKPQRVVLYIRVSGRSQADGLRHQRDRLVAELEKRGFQIIAIFEEIAPGWLEGRIQLARAICMAKAENAIVVAESVNRFWRSSRRETKTQPLCLLDIDRLLAEADGVTLATLDHPDKPSEQVHGSQTKRGQHGTGNFGGRPKKKSRTKDRRLEFEPLVMDMWAKGYSLNAIHRALWLPLTTVWTWVQRKKWNALLEPTKREGHP